MSSNTDLNKTIDVVINIGHWAFKLTDYMMSELNIDDPFPSMEQLPRHDKRLVELVKAGHGTVYHNENKRGLVVKTITENRYRICEYDGYEYIETPNSIKWTTMDSE